MFVIPQNSRLFPYEKYRAVVLLVYVSLLIIYDFSFLKHLVFWYSLVSADGRSHNGQTQRKILSEKDGAGTSTGNLCCCNPYKQSDTFQ